MAASAATRNAEALFESKNVNEIRQIEARTRRDIEDKKLQLRQLVGESYRDLIEGTSKVLDISHTCSSIVKNILAMQESFGCLVVDVSSTLGNAQDGKEFVRNHQLLHAMGSRVKYILDTPEVIWGCLDSQQHLEAARRLLRVHEVYSHVQQAFAADVAAKFPLLSHQWPLVLKFRQQVQDNATGVLSGTKDLTITQAADAIAALVLLEGLDSAAALQQLLSGRKHWVLQQLKQALAGAGKQQQQQLPGQVLAQVIQQVQSCVEQVGVLFTDQRGSSGQPTSSQADAHTSLLQQVLQEDEADASELFFGGVTGSDGSSSSPEAAVWQQRHKQACQQLEPLQHNQVQQACSAWLDDVAALCRELGLTLLHLCDTADSLLAAEQAVQQAIADWTATPIPAECDADLSDVQAAAGQTIDGRLDRPVSTGVGGQLSKAEFGQAGLGAGALGGRRLSDWHMTADKVLGHQLDLWQVLLHAPFLDCCKDLIKSALQDASSSIDSPLQETLQQAAQHEPEAAGQLQPGTWPSVTSHTGHADSVLLDRTYSFASGRTSSGAWGALPHSLQYSMSGLLVGVMSGELQDAQNKQGGFRNEVFNIRHVFDSKLHAVLQAVLALAASSNEPDANPPSRLGSSAQSLSMLHLSRTASNPAPARTGRMPVHNAQSSAQQPAASAAAAACLAAGKARSAGLQLFAQQQCLQMVQQLAGKLQQQLQQLQQPQEGIQGVHTVEQVLLIGRLCDVLASNSSMLPAVLGPPGAWPSASKAGPNSYNASQTTNSSSSSTLPASIAAGMSALGPAAAALLRLHHPGLAMQTSDPAAAATAAQLATVQQQLHAIACSGYEKWAAWVAGSMAADLAVALANDELLRSTGTPLSWVETRVAGYGGSEQESDAVGNDAGEGGEMRFALPACPSAEVLQMLSLACWETRRAGEHFISTNALRLLQWHLHGAALTVLQQLGTSAAAMADSGAASTNPARSSITEKGVLQLLFDQRLLRDVLGGGKPASVATVGGNAAADAAAALSERKRFMSAVEQQLQDLLDPIDWATYEPYLWANAQRFYQRVSVLLGSLTQLQKPYADAPLKASSSANSDINAMNLLPVAPRFHYLPISTPTAVTSSSAKQRANAAVGVTFSLTGSVAYFGGWTAPAAGTAAGSNGAQQQLTLAGISDQAADLAAQYIITESGARTAKGQGAAARQPAGAAPAAAGPFGASLPLSADAAAAAGASALSALQACLQGSSFGAFGSMLGDRAAEVTAMAQNIGDLLPSAGLGGGLLSSFAARRDGIPPGAGSKK